MNKRIFAVLFGISLCSLCFAGCSEDISEEDTKEQTQQTIQFKTIDKDIKEQLSKKIEDVLQDYDISSVDILTLTDNKPKAMVQMKTNILKKDINKNEAIELCKEVGQKIKPICGVYDIELIDPKYQLILLTDQEENNKFIDNK